MFNRIPEKCQPGAFVRQRGLPRPSEVLQWAYVPFGMRHQPQNQARRIAHTCDRVDAAVGVVDRTIRLHARIDKRDLILLVKCVPNFLRRGNELPFAVRDRQLEFADPRRPDALAADVSVDVCPQRPASGPGSSSVFTST
jgi:hypothetical protein